MSFGHPAHEPDREPEVFLRDALGRVIGELMHVDESGPSYALYPRGALRWHDVAADPADDWDDFADEDPESWAPLDMPAPDEDPADFAPTEDDARWWAEQSRGSDAA